jgi:UDP-glucose 4-epimerase
MIHVWQQVTGRQVPYKVVARRLGDAVSVFASTAEANTYLGWQAQRSLHDVCRDQWHWAENYPHGYK